MIRGDLFFMARIWLAFTSMEPAVPLADSSNWRRYNCKVKLSRLCKYKSEVKYSFHSPTAANTISVAPQGSAKHELVEKVRAALEEIKTREPNLLVDGELQLDAAVEPEVARLKAPGSPVAGNANVFVFPSLEAGNIGYKIAQRFGGWTALGPLLQGFAHGWHDLSRGCSSDDIYKISVVGLGMNRGGQQ